MAFEERNENGKVHLEDSSQEALRTYKRRRLPESGSDTVGEQVSEAFWKSRDIGWDHGIMIDENRQHWKCMYCGLIRHGGGVSRLKRHLAGDLDVKRCPRVPKEVSKKIRDHLMKKRGRRKKAAAHISRSMNMSGSHDNILVDKDQFFVDLEMQAGSVSQALEEGTEQLETDQQDPIIPEASHECAKLGPKLDLAWEHAAIIDGNRRRWECNWCGMRRGGGLTALKAHLTDNSCPDIPKDVAKKLLDYIVEKRIAHRTRYSSCPKSMGTHSRDDDKLDEDQVLDLQMPHGSTTGKVEEATRQLQSGHQLSNNTMQRPEMDAVIEETSAADMALQPSSSQLRTKISKPLVENHKQSIESGGQPAEPESMEHSSLLMESALQQVVNREHEAANLELLSDRNIRKFQTSQAVPSRFRHICWKHALMVDVDTRRWECKWCGICRSGGITTLRAHLGKSCPNIPKDVRKKMRDHIRKSNDSRSKTRALHKFGTTSMGTGSCGDDKHEDQVLNLQMPLGNAAEDSKEASRQVKSDHPLSSNAVQRSERGAVIEETLAADLAWQPASSQWSAESSERSVEHDKQSIESDGQPVEHGSTGHGSLLMRSGMLQVVNRERETDNRELPSNRNIGNSQTSKASKWRTMFNPRKHVVMIDATERHWRCRYCGMDGYGKMSRFKRHLAGVFRHPRCPNVPEEISRKARNQIMLKTRLKMKRADAYIHYNSMKTRLSDVAKVGKDCVFVDLETQAASNQVSEEANEQLKIDNQTSNSPTQLSTKNVFTEVPTNFSRFRDSAWEHSFVVDREKGHWQCKWCGLNGYHGVTRLKWHLVGWNNRRQCPRVPEDAAKKIRDQMKSREEQKKNRSSALDTTNSTEIPCSAEYSRIDGDPVLVDGKMRAGSSTQAFDEATKKLRIPNVLSNNSLKQPQASAHAEPVIGEPHDSESYEHTDKQDANAGTSGCWGHWRTVLESVLQLADLHESGGVRSCILEALKYGPIGADTVMANDHTDTEKSQVSYVRKDDGRADPNVNTAKCRNVLVDILRSENFALLSNILWRTVHHDEKRNIFFDLTKIDSKMKNGDYERSPELFNRDIQLVWKDIRKAGQEIIHLASNLSAITQASYMKQVEGLKRLGRGEQKTEETGVACSQQKNLTESDVMILSGSWDSDHSTQPDQMETSAVNKDIICKEYGHKLVNKKGIRTCDGCKEAYHIRCALYHIPLTAPSNYWYCETCLDDQQKAKETVVACSQTKNLTQTNATISFTSRDLDHSFIPDQSVKSSVIHTCGTCKKCGYNTNIDTNRTCVGCKAVYHISCIRPSFLVSTTASNWYCETCFYDQSNPEETGVACSPKKNLTESNATISFALRDSDHSTQPDQSVNSSTIHTCSTCKKCGHEANIGLKRTCVRCKAVYHTSCIRPSYLICTTANNWYCETCFYGQSNPKETNVTCSQQRTFTESKAMIPSASRDSEHSTQPDQIKASAVEEGIICKECGYKIKNKKGICTCARCNEVYHIGCVHPPSLFSATSSNWYCETCLDDQQKAEEAGVACSPKKNSTESNVILPFTLRDSDHLAQSDQRENSAVDKGNTCKKCGYKLANRKGIRTCVRCNDIYHLGCVHPRILFTAPSSNWCCETCLDDRQKAKDTGVACPQQKNLTGSNTMMSFTPRDSDHSTQPDQIETSAIDKGNTCKECGYKLANKKGIRACVRCNDVYHLGCVHPHILFTAPSSNWCCKTCLDDQQKAKETDVACSQQKNLSEPNETIPFTSRGSDHSTQPDQIDTSAIDKGNTCKECGYKLANQKGIRTCVGCNDVYHIGCVHPHVLFTAPSSNWYCETCLDHQQKAKETGVACSQQKNLIKSNAMRPFASRDSDHSSQPDQMEAAFIHKGITCKKCGYKANNEGNCMCVKCKAVYHIRCVPPSIPFTTTGGWYCETCFYDQQNNLHENCVVCDQLEVSKAPEVKGTSSEGPAVDESRVVPISSTESTEFPQLSKTAMSRLCKLCGACEDDDKRFLICGHVHCPYKYYHIRCLKTHQIASTAQQNKPCWFCPSCLCRGCLSDRDDDQIILCDGCDEAYHLYCMTPRRTSVPKGRWYCVSCSVGRAKEGMRQYEKKILRLHRKDDIRQKNDAFKAVDLLLCAAEKLRWEETVAEAEKIARSNDWWEDFSQ